jgi:hypothetical protein
MKLVFRIFITLSLIAALVVVVGGTAWAKDAAVAVVDAPGAIVMHNGNHYSQGTNAIGTIQLFYTVVAEQFTGGYFGSFDLDLSIKEGKPKPPTYYPLYLNLRQTGSKNLELDPATGSFHVYNSGFTGSTTVNIIIPQSVADDPAFQVDGAELVANLQMETAGELRQYHLDTATTIKVHLILMYPSDGACLLVRNFIANNGITGEVDPLSVSKSSVGQQSVSSDPNNPHYIVLAANTCSIDQCIDSSFSLHSDFQLKSGQPVKTFSSNSIIDEFSEVNTLFASSPTADPNNDIGMCVTAAVSTDCSSGGIPVPAGETFLLKADFEIKTNATFPPPASYSGFGASILDGGSTSTCTVTGTLNSVADPNPVSKTLNAQCVTGQNKMDCQ